MQNMAEENYPKPMLYEASNKEVLKKKLAIPSLFFL